MQGLITRLLPLLSLVVALTLAAPASAAGLDLKKPEANAPTAKEQVELYRPEPSDVRGTVSIPDSKLGMLVQPEGRDWRGFRTDTVVWTAGALIVGMLIIVTVFYFIRGRVEIVGGPSGRRVLRFNGIDRFAHWLTAVSFIAMALTGLVVTFGRSLLIPVMGHAAFTGMAEWSKTIHNFCALPFVLGLVLIVGLWIRDNFPERGDWSWLKTMGGLMSRHGRHPACGRFNAGQKGIFWAVVLGGIALAVTGFMLLNPFAFTDVDGMQWVHRIHGIVAGLLIAIIIAHIYIGSVGMEGAFDAMGSGEVDENWAREHHKLWYERQVSRGYADSSRPPSQRPAE